MHAQRVPDAPLRKALELGPPHHFPDAVGEIVELANEFWLASRSASSGEARLRQGYGGQPSPASRAKVGGAARI